MVPAFFFYANTIIFVLINIHIFEVSVWYRTGLLGGKDGWLFGIMHRALCARRNGVGGSILCGAQPVHLSLQED